MAIQHNNDDLPIDELRGQNHIVLFRHDHAPMFLCWIRRVDGDKLAARRIQIGLEIKNAALIADKRIFGVGFIQQPHKIPVALHRTIINPVAIDRTMPHIQHKILPIISYLRRKIEFWRVRALENQHIVGLRRTQFMPVKRVVERNLRVVFAAFWLRKAIIVKAGTVLTPRNAGKLAPFQDFIIFRQCIDVANTNLLPIAPRR